MRQDSHFVTIDLDNLGPIIEYEAAYFLGEGIPYPTNMGKVNAQGMGNG